MLCIHNIEQISFGFPQNYGLLTISCQIEGNQFTCDFFLVLGSVFSWNSVRYTTHKHQFFCFLFSFGKQGKAKKTGTLSIKVTEYYSNIESNLGKNSRTKNHILNYYTLDIIKYFIFCMPNVHLLCHCYVIKVNEFSSFSGQMFRNAYTSHFFLILLLFGICV